MSINPALRVMDNFIRAADPETYAKLGDLQALRVLRLIDAVFEYLPCGYTIHKTQYNMRLNPTGKKLFYEERSGEILYIYWRYIVWVICTLNNGIITHRPLLLVEHPEVYNYNLTRNHGVTVTDAMRREYSEYLDTLKKQYHGFALMCGDNVQPNSELENLTRDLDIWDLRQK